MRFPRCVDGLQVAVVGSGKFAPRHLPVDSCAANQQHRDAVIIKVKCGDRVEPRLLLSSPGLQMATPPVSATAVASLPWTAQGPGPNTEGQVEGIRGKEVVGAVQTVAVHPEDANIVYVGAVNGGIWRTTNAMAASPNWQQLTDGEMSLSIGVLEFDPTDSTRQTLVAGTGRFSSLRGIGGALIGLLRTTNGGVNWTTIGGGTTWRDLFIRGVAPRGNTIVIAARNGGVFRTTNTGASWSRISGTPGTGLPAGDAFDLASDPTDQARLFTHAGTRGLFRSTDTGATWSKVSNAAIDAVLASARNVKISVGRSNNVYVALADSEQLTGLFRSGDGGATWAQLDRPATVEGAGVSFGIHPGSQTSTHLSLAADRDNPTIAYVGGDRQPAFNEGAPNLMPPLRRFPNSIGAGDFSGRLFRVDASRPTGGQAVHLTHSNTANRTAPHADSRDMAMAVNGVLVEVDDGGVYRRTQPQSNNGDWFSMNGNLRTTEFHSVAWDANSRIIIGGAQDTGSPQQLVTADPKWESVSTGDGGSVAVDAISTPGRSTRYSSFQELRGFRRQVYDAANVLRSSTLPRMLVLGGGARVIGQFLTPIELNRVTPIRLIIGARNGVYESDDQADTVNAIGPGIQVNDSGAIAYGAANNRDMLYVGSGSTLFIRTAARPAPLIPSATYPGGRVIGIAVPPDDAQTAYVIDPVDVHRTANAGASWSKITGNLPTLGPAVLRSIAFCSGIGGGALVVGTNTGVFVASGPAFSTWTRLGSGLPNAPVFRLQYSEMDRILLAATLGRGAWTLAIPEQVIV
jgi:photosystem II stability/assembly factor-like uncharacterized protein